MFEQLIRQPAPVRVPAPRPQPKPVATTPKVSRRCTNSPHWRPNPWKLTAGQIQCMTALIECGGVQAAARKLGLHHKTVETQVCRAKQNMGLDTQLQAALEFDRFIRSQSQ